MAASPCGSSSRLLFAAVFAVAALALPILESAAVAAEPSASGDASARFRFVAVDDAGLGLWEGNRPVLVYNHGVREHRDAPPDRRRSTYVHPLYGLDGEVLTDDFPRDHYHHRGLFWAWPHVEVDGKDYDLWTLRGVRQQFERWEERSAADVPAVLAVENGWYVGQKRIVKEQVRLLVYAGDQDERIIDVHLALAAINRPVSLRGAEGKGYGGLSLRFAPRQETQVTTESGIEREDADLRPLAWADLSGLFAGRQTASGVAIFSQHAADAREQWITRNYGFLGVGWPTAQAATLKPGAPISTRYRLVIHRRRPDLSRMKQLADQWRATPAEPTPRKDAARKAAPAP